MKLIGSHHVLWNLAVEYISYKIILLRSHLDDSELEGCDNGKSLNFIEQSPASYRTLNFRMAYTLDLRSLTFKYMHSFFRPLSR